MSAVDPVAMAEMERERAETAARIVALQARLASASSHRRGLADLLGEGEDCLPLPMVPLNAALVGAVAANAAVFFGFIIYLTRFHETIWNALLVLVVVLGAGSLPFSRQQGAGGRARVGLRRFAIAGLVLALVEVLLTLPRT